MLQSKKMSMGDVNGKKEERLKNKKRNINVRVEKKSFTMICIYKQSVSKSKTSSLDTPSR